MKIKIQNYIFNAAAKQITFSDYASISLDSILLITNVISNIIIYNFADPTSGGTVSGNSSVCSGNTSGLLSLTGYTGTVQKWQYAVSPFTTWTDITNNNDTYTSGALTETTRFRAVVKSGACLTLNSGYKQIVVKPNPTFTSGTVSPSNCYGNDVIFTASGLLPNINNTLIKTPNLMDYRML